MKVHDIHFVNKVHQQITIHEIVHMTKYHIARFSFLIDYNLLLKSIFNYILLINVFMTY